MRRPLAIGCALAVAALVALTAGVAVGAETPYHFSGKTSKNGNGAVTHEVSCANGYYVRNSGDPSLSTSGETLTIEESMTLRARTENAGHVGVEHEWSWSCA